MAHSGFISAQISECHIMAGIRNIVYLFSVQMSICHSEKFMVGFSRKNKPFASHPWCWESTGIGLTSFLTAAIQSKVANHLILYPLKSVTYVHAASAIAEWYKTRLSGRYAFRLEGIVARYP